MSLPVAKMVDPMWEWFCGVNSTDLNSSGDWLQNTCFIDALSIVPHAAFALSASLVLLILRCCTGYNKAETKYLLKYPGHKLRWLLGFLLIIICSASIGEGILTDQTYRAFGRATQPHLYVSGASALIACLLSLVFYHHAELWQAPAMSLLLLCYWLTAAGAEGLRTASLDRQNLIDFNLMRFDITVALLVCIGILLLTEVYVTIPQICRRLCNFKDNELPRDLRNPNMKYMNSHVNLASYITFWWINWLFALGYKKPLDLDDLGDIPDRHEARQNHLVFKRTFLEVKAEAERQGKSPSLYKVYMKVYGARLAAAAVVKLAADTLGLVGPLCIGGITAYVIDIEYASEDEEVAPHFVSTSEYFSNGFVLVIVLFLVSVLRIVCLHVVNYQWTTLESIHVRTAIQAMVYEKALRLSTFATSGGQMTMGQITNHMSTDAMAIHYMFQTTHYLVIVPIQTLITLVVLYFKMGVAALLGFTVLFVVILIQLKVAVVLSRHQKGVFGCSDQRLKQCNELLQGIKLLKLYAWEHLYCDAIEAVRKRELGFLKNINYTIIITMFLTSGAPIIVTLVAFGSYTALTGLSLTPDVTFSSLALFNELTLPLFVLPISLATVVNATVSTKRLLRFLLAPEMERNEADWTDELQSTRIKNADTDPEVTFREKNGQAPVSHPLKEHSATVGNQTDDDIELKPMDGDVTTDSNANDTGVSCHINGGFTPTPEDEDLGQDCAVKITNGNFTWEPDSNTPDLSDINIKIPAGKLTMIIGPVGSGKSSLVSAILGEMTTMSGKVQINRKKGSIAFAAQKPWLLNASLQDNVLFSRDMDKTRYKKAINACALKPDIAILPAGDQTEIGEKGINLSGGQKQRVSVARTMYSGRDIIILDDPLSALDVHVGRQLFEKGVLKWLLRNKHTVILVTHQIQYLGKADLIIEVHDGRVVSTGKPGDTLEVDLETISLASPLPSSPFGRRGSELMPPVKDVQQERKELLRRLSKQLSIDESRDELIGQEERAQGSVSHEVYKYYMSNAGWGLVSFILVAMLMTSALNVGKSLWLSAWSEAGLSSENFTSNDVYVSGYAGFSIATVVSQMMLYTGVVMAALVACRRLHRKMLRNIVRVPLRFFDTTPIGRVLNRFSNDTQMIDAKLAQTMNILLGYLLQCLSAIVVNTIVMPFFIIFVIPIGIGYYFLQKYFIATSRELQRIDSTSKSPMFAYLSESLGGLSTIRAYGDRKRFYKTFISRINTNVTAYLYLQTVNRWLAIRLDLIGALFVLLAGLSTLTGAVAFDVGSSLVGLGVTYSLQVSGYLNWLVRSVADIEMQMNCVERVKYYTDVENEKYEGEEPVSDWPTKGEIKFESVSVRYGKGMPAVLKRVSICFKQGEKVGICGRTGSGKSTLTLALLRVIDVFEGKVLIDDVDITSVPLSSLRSKLSVIPQDPVLFTGSVRINLDPEMTQSDAHLWEALEIAQLKETVSNLEGGLDGLVTEGGDNFSVGQRQLFCLARAFLRKSRILIMDEATASIDLETEKILLTVQRTAFAERTVLTIAHRISTIMDSDSILVLDDGHVAEYGSPAELQKKEYGLFTSLVKDETPPSPTFATFPPWPMT